MAEEFEWYVGIDWAMAAHELCVIDAAGAVIDRRSVPHSGDGLAELAERLLRLCSGEPERVAAAIEMPHGAVVETLLERGFAVFSLNPKQLDRFRDRYSPAGAKDDRLDAYVLADSARTDLHCFRRLQVPPAEMIRLRELVRTEEERSGTSGERSTVSASSCIGTPPKCWPCRPRQTSPGSGISWHVPRCPTRAAGCANRRSSDCCVSTGFAACRPETSGRHSRSRG